MEPAIDVLVQRLIDQQLDRLRAYLLQAHELVAHPTDGTVARADLGHVNASPNATELAGLHWWAHRSAILNVHAAAEHLMGVRAILSSGELLPLPAMAAGRAVYEAVIQTCWLLDVEVSVEQRVARWAGRLLHDTQEPPNALDTFGEAEAVEHEKSVMVEGRALGQQLMTEAGFQLLAKGGDRADETRHVSYHGAVSQLTPNISDFVARFTPDQQSLWTLFSGANHSRGWLVAGIEGHAEELVTSILTPLIDTGDALAVEVGRYFGLNPRDVVTRLHRHRGVLLRRARASSTPMKGVDAYRAASGAYPLPPKTS